MYFGMEASTVVIPICCVASFTLTYLSTPRFMRFLRDAGIVGRDVMKPGKPPVPEMGGPPVLIGFLFGLFLFTGLNLFVLGTLKALTDLLASISTVLIISFFGVFDTLTCLIPVREGVSGFERYKRRGLSIWMHFLLPLPAAIPLMAVKAGTTTMDIPFVGVVDLGCLYPLLVVPVALLLVSNATNMLAGLNGLEAGMGFVMLTTVGVFALVRGRVEAAALSLTFAASLLAFLRYNWYPAKIFPGDLNYVIGAVMVCTSVVGNMEKISVLCFAPWAVEAFLKLSSKFRAESFGILQQDGTLKPPPGGVHSLTHLVMRMGRFREWQVTAILMAVEACVCVLAFLHCLEVI